MIVPFAQLRKLRDWYNNIPNCDCEHGISYSSTYRSRLCFSDIDRFCMDCVSSRFCWVICSLSFYPCQRISWVCGLHNLRSVAVASWTWTGTRIFELEVVMFLQLPNSYYIMCSITVLLKVWYVYRWRYAYHRLPVRGYFPEKRETIVRDRLASLAGPWHIENKGKSAT